ncbi:hypothetical protein BN855_20070 [Salmonella enterica subsp. enterica serovar Bovismorbificans str. 3114]|nr:hypothetical protein BN855_20070 [Salmonella enterica subsp. enterica serovar Bovismorbificans str. 3114]
MRAAERLRLMRVCSIKSHVDVSSLCCWRNSLEITKPCWLCCNEENSKPPETSCSSAKTPSTIISIVTTRIRLNIRHLPDNELSTLSAPAVITLLLQKGNTLFRKTTLPMTVSQRRCRRKMQGLGAGDEEALSPLAEA